MFGYTLRAVRYCIVQSDTVRRRRPPTAAAHSLTGPREATIHCWQSDFSFTPPSTGSLPQIVCFRALLPRSIRPRCCSSILFVRSCLPPVTRATSASGLVATRALLPAPQRSTQSRLRYSAAIIVRRSSASAPRHLRYSRRCLRFALHMLLADASCR